MPAEPAVQIKEHVHLRHILEQPRLSHRPHTSQTSSTSTTSAAAACPAAAHAAPGCPLAASTSTLLPASVDGQLGGSRIDDERAQVLSKATGPQNTLTRFGNPQGPSKNVDG